MFENVGSKVKTLARVVCWIGIIGSIIGGIAIMAQGENLFLVGILSAVLGSFFSWIGSLSLYAIGEAAENSAIAANLAIKADMERENTNKISSEERDLFDT